MSSYEPLHGPDDLSPAPESLGVEIATARRIIGETSVLNIHDHMDMLKAAVALNCRVRGLLAALDAERGEGQ